MVVQRSLLPLWRTELNRGLCRRVLPLSKIPAKTVALLATLVQRHVNFELGGLVDLVYRLVGFIWFEEHQFSSMTHWTCVLINTDDNSTVLS